MYINRVTSNAMTRLHYFISLLEDLLAYFDFHGDITDRESTSCISFPIWTELRITFPCFIPMHIGYTACTIREQFGNRYAVTVWCFWNILVVLDGFSPFFPYLLIYRTEEVAGSNPARSTFSQWLLLLSPPQERAANRLSLLHTAGTIREQFGYKYPEIS
jgi:hypothetical protein